MPFDVLLHINEDSQRGRVIQRMVDAQHVTPEQVIDQIIDAGIQAQPLATLEPVSGKTPAEMLLGLFSSPEDSSLMDEVMLSERELRGDRTVRRGPRAPLRTDDGQTVIGAFKGKQGFRESVDAVIASRAQRYGG